MQPRGADQGPVVLACPVSPVHGDRPDGPGCFAGLVCLIALLAALAVLAAGAYVVIVYP